MQTIEAVKLIKHEKLLTNESRIWADFGCGNGTFTQALAEILPAESLIYAIDSNRNSLNLIPNRFGQVKIEKLRADFVFDRLPLKNLSGILMANSLHFVEDKQSFIRSILKYLKPVHKLLIVEYDTSQPNFYVPFPIRFTDLPKFFDSYETVKIAERTSIYNNGKMYSAILENANFQRNCGVN